PSTESYLEEHLRGLRGRDASRRRWRYTLYVIGAAAAATALGFGLDAIAIHQRIVDVRTPQLEVIAAIPEHRHAVYGMSVGLGVAVASFLTGWLGFREGP